MQRRTRIALAITAAAGAALLGTGTAFADGFTDILGGADTSQASSPAPYSSDADSSDSDADSSDSDSDSSDADSSDSGSDSSDSDSSDDSSDD
jgi:cobalamin biosynthesis protein CobT